MKLRHKLLMAPILTALGVLAAGQVDSYFVARSAEAVQAGFAAQVTQPKIINDVQDQLAQAHTGVYRTMAIVGSMDDAKLTAVRADLVRQLQGVERVLSGLAGHGLDAALIQGVRTQTGLYTKQADMALDLASVDPNTGVAALQTADATFQNLNQQFVALGAKAEAYAADEASAASQQEAKLHWLLLALGLGTALIAIWASWLMLRRVVNVHQMGHELDVAAWDSYPLGSTDIASFLSEAERVRWARSGHPDIPAFHHDLYRGLCRGRWWVMEQQAGPVNWAPWNAEPLPGMVRAWTWEAIAHGAELVSYFRWRQLPYAQEQMHSGLNASDDSLDVGGREAAQVALEMQSLQALLEAPTALAKVALVFDYASGWMTEIQPHGADMDYFAGAFRCYSALRQLGLDIDLVAAHAPLAEYDLVVLPGLIHLPDALMASLRAAQQRPRRAPVWVFGPRCGSKTEWFRTPDRLPPGPLAEFLPMQVRRVESLRPARQISITAGGQAIGHALRWREFVEPGAGVSIDARFEDGHPALLSHGALRYVCADVDGDLLRGWLEQAARDAGLRTRRLPDALRLRSRGNLQFAFNYGSEAIRLPFAVQSAGVLGGPELPPAGVAAWPVQGAAP